MPVTYQLTREPKETDKHVMAKRVDDSVDPPHESFVPWNHINNHPYDLHGHAGHVWERDGKPEAAPPSPEAVPTNWVIGFDAFIALFTDAEKQAIYDGNAKWQVKHFLAMATGRGASLSLRDPVITRQVGGLPVWLPKNVGFTPQRAKQVLNNEAPPAPSK
jgi:hypothetical protein